ncbi:unnamed protein product [Diamesa tonsa]
MFHGKLETIGNFTNFLIKVKQFNSEYEEYSENTIENNGIVVVWESAVQPMTDIQRLTFEVLTILISFVAIVGNILVLYVNFLRKKRLLLRTCLISLAVSDLMYVITTIILYIPKLSTKNSTLWLLGPLSCALIPFVRTMTVLVNSILLVSIAMDRYMAVVRINKGDWNPDLCLSVSIVILIWGMCAGVSSPMLTFYDHYKIFIVPFPDPMEIDPVLSYYEGYLCGFKKEESSYYFVMLFVLIFLPILTTFLWLITILAKEVWNHRNQVQVEQRNIHIRMLKVIALLMAVLIICRLPYWIYVLYKVSSITISNYLILYYSFGILVLFNCLLNPFLYTFLSEIIRLKTFLLKFIDNIFCMCGKKTSTKEPITLST